MLLGDIADSFRILRSDTHRVPTSLVERGYVRQESRHGGYQLTAKIVTLAFDCLAGIGVTDLAQPILNRLASETGELVRLAVIYRERLIWVAKSRGLQFGRRYNPAMGRAARLSCSASGIAWLSCLPEGEALALVEKQGYGRRAEYGPKAPQTPQAYFKYLSAARRNGFALVLQTYSHRINTIAEPIRDA
jgi:IclR family acetate operon transcriptional repressor